MDAIMDEQRREQEQREDTREASYTAAKEEHRRLSLKMLELLETHSKAIEKMKHAFATTDRLRYNTRAQEKKWKQGQIVVVKESRQQDRHQQTEVAIDGEHVKQFYTEAKSIE